MPTDPQTDELTNQEIDYLIGQAGGCEHCGTLEGVDREASRTQYHFDGEPETADDPNRSRAYCRECAREHHEYWDSMWADYYGSRI